MLPKALPPVVLEADALDGNSDRDIASDCGDTEDPGDRAVEAMSDEQFV